MGSLVAMVKKEWRGFCCGTAASMFTPKCSAASSGWNGSCWTGKSFACSIESSALWSTEVMLTNILGSSSAPSSSISDFFSPSGLACGSDDGRGRPRRCQYGTELFFFIVQRRFRRCAPPVARPDPLGSLFIDPNQTGRHWRLFRFVLVQQSLLFLLLLLSPPAKRTAGSLRKRFFFTCHFLFIRIDGSRKRIVFFFHRPATECRLWFESSFVLFEIVGILILFVLRQRRFRCAGSWCWSGGSQRLPHRHPRRYFRSGGGRPGRRGGRASARRTGDWNGRIGEFQGCYFLGAVFVVGRWNAGHFHC